MPASLWRHADFLKFWAGQTISGFGSRFTGLALPILAISELGASPAQLGVLVAVNGLPWLILGPFAGVGVDRFRRRRVMIAADAGRAILLAAIPVAWMLNSLSMELVYLVALGVGILTMCFDIAYQSYLPTLVDRSQLIDGNSKLGVSSSVADVAGPGLAGVLIQLLGAPIAIAVDAVSFVASLVSLWLIRTLEPAPRAAGSRPAMLTAVREGLTYLRRQPILRGFAATNATFMFCYGMLDAVFLLFLTRSLGFSPSTIGIIFGTGSLGGLLGAIAAGRVSTRFGVGLAILWSSVVRGLGIALIPLVALLWGGMAPVVVVLLYAVHQCGWSIWSVTQASLRQALVPDRMQGRVTASFLVLVRAAPPLGALLGGILGEWGGIQLTLGLAAPGLVLASLWLLMSPLLGLRTVPLQPADE